MRVGGAVDPRRTDEVRGWIRGLRAAGVRHLVVDVSAAGDRDAGLLGVLARTRAGLVAAGGTLRVTGVALPQFLVALQHAELDEVFVVYDALRRGRAATGRPVHPAVSSPG